MVKSVKNKTVLEQIQEIEKFLEDNIDILSKEEIEEGRTAIRELYKKNTLEVMGYSSMPITIDQFIEDEYYLGRALNTAKGNSVYPIWREVLREIYPNPLESPYTEVCLTGAIGIGKTTVAMIGSLYDIYKLLLIKNPQYKYDLLPTTRILFHIFSATKYKSKDNNWAQIRDLVDSSPFFQEHTINSHDNAIHNRFKNNIGFGIGSQAVHATGDATFSALMDETSEEGVKDRSIKNYNAISQRMQSRFMQKGGIVPGHMWLISSSKIESSFLENHIRNTKNDDRIKVYAFSIWEAIKHKGNYSGEMFKVFIGNDTQDPVIIDDSVNRNVYEDDDIIDVPIEYHKKFAVDTRLALQEIAGITTSSGAYRLFPSREKLNQVFVVPNYFKKDIIEIDFNNEKDQLKNYFDLEVYIKQRQMTTNQRFIHIDTGLTNDRFGLSCAFISGYKVVQRYDIEKNRMVDYREPIVTVEWAVAIQAKPNQEIPYFKIRQFLIQDLVQRKVYFSKITLDGYQSRDFRQMLERAGIKSEILSLDRNMDGYLSFRNGVYESRVMLPKSELLKKECRELLIIDGKCDHPKLGSKDIADSVAGSVFNALTCPTKSRDMVSQVSKAIKNHVTNKESIYDKIRRGEI